MKWLQKLELGKTIDYKKGFCHILAWKHVCKQFDCKKGFATLWPANMSASAKVLSMSTMTKSNDCKIFKEFAYLTLRYILLDWIFAKEACSYLSVPKSMQMILRLRFDLFKYTFITLCKIINEFKINQYSFKKVYWSNWYPLKFQILLG